MKYIRTKDGIYEVKHDEKNFIYKGSNMIAIYDPKIYQVRDIHKDEIIKQADNIEELCDCYSYDIETTRDYLVAKSWKLHRLEREVYGCIKTNEGLIYVAKMNEKGDLELI